MDKEQDIPDAREKSVRGVADWGGCGGCWVMNTVLECLSCNGVEVLGYFQLLDMRYGDGDGGVSQFLQWIKQIKIDSFLLVVWIILLDHDLLVVSSRILTNLTINKISVFW